MPAEIGQPSQRKQPSRKGRKAWRKNVDITEVQDGLETLREEIRQGGPISEKPSDELFIFDTAGSEDIRKKHKLTKTLKADEILAQRSAVPGVDSRKRSARITDGVLEPAAKRRRQDWVSRKELQRLKESLDASSHLESHQLANGDDAGFDVWADAPSADLNTVDDEYIPKVRPKVAPTTIFQAPIPLTATGKAVRAVRNPDAGTSYNPTFESWDDLLNREGDKEVEAERKRLEKAEKEAEKEAAIALSAAQADREADTDYESGWEGFETDNDESSLKRKRPERKTATQRNKINRRKELERKAKHEAATGKKQKQAENAVMALIKDNNRGELVQHDAESSDDENEEGTKIRRRKRGTMKIPEQNLEVVLPDELQESLRRLKPEGNLMNDRFRNLLVNGKLDNRALVHQKRKKQVKVTEKWSYKDFEIRV